MIAKHFGMLTDKVQVEQTGPPPTINVRFGKPTPKRQTKRNRSDAMPYFRLVDQETGDVKEVRRMDKSVASKLNETAENGHRWLIGLEPNGSPNPIRSITTDAIA